MENKSWDKLEKQLQRELKPIIIKDGYHTTEVIVFKGALGDMATEWWTDKDYEEHNKYVEELKRKGEYLKPEIISISLQYHPAFDNPTKPKKLYESYRMTILDFNK